MPRVDPSTRMVASLALAVGLYSGLGIRSEMNESGPPEIDASFENPDRQICLVGPAIPTMMLPVDRTWYFPPLPDPPRVQLFPLDRSWYRYRAIIYVRVRLVDELEPIDGLYYLIWRIWP
jgi:hypothetical protein